MRAFLDRFPAMGLLAPPLPFPRAHQRERVAGDSLRCCGIAI